MVDETSDVQGSYTKNVIIIKEQFQSTEVCD